MFRYQAYSLDFASELECPELPDGANGSVEPDVVVRLGPVASSLNNPTFSERYFETSQDALLLRLEGIACYLVTAGREIVIEPCREADPAKVRLFLLGSAMGALLYQRGMFLLHGSAVETAWGAMVFVGPQGIGKSTLAAHFQQRGYRILNDDVCAVIEDGGGKVVALPAFPHMRLCTDALERLRAAGADEAGRPARFDVDKYVVPLGRRHCSQPTELAAVHGLMEHEAEGIIVRPLRGFEGVDLLLTNLYRPQFLRGLDAAGDVMRMATAVVAGAEIMEVRRPRDAGQIERMLDSLEAAWKTAHAKRRERVK